MDPRSSPDTTGRHLPACRCGQTREHPLVEATPRYGFWGWFVLFQGVTRTPKTVTFRCRQCRQVVEVSHDPEVLRQHR
jgi:hypothetical protein